VFGVAKEVSEQIVDRINPANQTDSNTPTSAPTQKKREARYDYFTANYTTYALDLQSNKLSLRDVDTVCR
jgi:hypothetical protein